MKRILVQLTVVLFSTVLYSQALMDLTLEERFKCQVKSLDEFLARLNGEESNPEITDTDYSRRDNIMALMDYQMSYNKNDLLFRQQLINFINAVELYPSALRDTSSLLFAQAQCSIKYKGKECKVVLILHKEADKEGFQRWTIVGANGLLNNGMINETKPKGISPVEHEIHFMGLTDIFKYHAADIMAYKGRNTNLDQLSVFLTLARQGLVSLLSVDKLTYHVLTIPNYVFTIDEIARIDYNSGWLISSFKEIKEFEKIEYVNKLLGK